MPLIPLFIQFIPAIIKKRPRTRITLEASRTAIINAFNRIRIIKTNDRILSIESDDRTVKSTRNRTRTT